MLSKQVELLVALLDSRPYPSTPDEIRNDLFLRLHLEFSGKLNFQLSEETRQ